METEEKIGVEPRAPRSVEELSLVEAENWSLKQRLDQSQTRLEELEAAMKSGVVEEAPPLAPPTPQRDRWKPVALGACLAAFLFAIAIGLLASDRQRGKARILELQKERTAQSQLRDAAERRVYGQNRDLADLTNKIRERDTRLAVLSAGMNKLNQQLVQTAKERETWRAVAAARAKNIQTVVVPAPLATPAPDEPPIFHRRRRQ